MIIKKTMSNIDQVSKTSETKIAIINPSETKDNVDQIFGQQTPQSQLNDPLSDGQSNGTADQQRDLVFQFCRDYAEENGFTIKTDNQNQSGDPGINDNYQDYEDVTGEKQYIT